MPQHIDTQALSTLSLITEQEEQRRRLEVYDESLDLFGIKLTAEDLDDAEETDDYLSIND